MFKALLIVWALVGGSLSKTPTQTVTLLPSMEDCLVAKKAILSSRPKVTYDVFGGEQTLRISIVAECYPAHADK